MAKHARKIKQGIDRRKDAFRSPHPVNGMDCKVPGSQNRKKSGFGKGSRR